MSAVSIENHGIIGNQETAALVCNDGTVDFMCFPRFDSPSVFASLLDAENGGFFKVEPVAGDFDRHQFYRPDTNILETTFRSDDATVIVCDLMAVGRAAPPRCLVRRVETIRGAVSFRMVCAPRFDYGRANHVVEKNRGGILFTPEKARLPAMLLRANMPLERANGCAWACFQLNAGQSAWFVLDEAFSRLPWPNKRWIENTIQETGQYWESWVKQSVYRGRWREMVSRSALTLALLMSKSDGSIVAAPTFGLPEWPGGDKNWDYRYSWIRDASFALDAFLKLGFTKEADSIMGWLEKRCRHATGKPPLQVVYRLDGRRMLPERKLDCLNGYKASRPVRIGNAASQQLQLDIYGELMDSVFLYSENGGKVSSEFWRHICSLVEWVCDNWKRPDDSIWEIRDGARPFLYSRAMCWLALDRAVKLAQRHSFQVPSDRWLGIQQKLHENIYSRFWNPKLRSFVQYQGAKILDGSLLLLPRAGFINSDDSRWRLTLKAIRDHLVEDCFVFRNRPVPLSKNHAPQKEGSFSACTFWYVEALVKADELTIARQVFEKFLGYANELGLFAEQLGPRHEHLGNFPQALSHISLIRAACDLDERLSRTQSGEKHSLSK
ncbi:MAG TPA: glycoside hydrolase family 15 protein [Verrucomicrobiae bacterium]|jgi:GH15 family glucan-1,4-alpha-glucosidase